MHCHYADLVNKALFCWTGVWFTLMELTGMRHNSASHSKRHLAVACRCVHEVDDIAVRPTRHWHPVHGHQLVARAQTAVPLRRAVLNNRSNYNLWQLIRGNQTLIWGQQGFILLLNKHSEVAWRSSGVFFRPQTVPYCLFVCRLYLEC